MSENSMDFSMMQVGEIAAILANAGASYYLYNAIQKIEKTLHDLDETDKANAAVNGRLATAITALEGRLAGIESRLAIMEQRLAASTTPIHPSIGYGGYDLPPAQPGYQPQQHIQSAQTDPRGYNPMYLSQLQSSQQHIQSVQPRTSTPSGSILPPPHQQQQQYPHVPPAQSYQPHQQSHSHQQSTPQHGQSIQTNPTQSYPGNRSEGSRSERINREQLMADAMMPPK